MKKQWSSSGYTRTYYPMDHCNDKFVFNFSFKMWSGFNLHSPPPHDSSQVIVLCGVGCVIL